MKCILAVLALTGVSCAVAEDTTFFGRESELDASKTNIGTDTGTRDTAMSDYDSTTPDSAVLTEDSAAPPDDVDIAETVPSVAETSVTETLIDDAGADVEPDACSVCSAGCCGGTCVDLKTDLKNCGACGKSCAVDQTCESGSCRCDPKKPVTSCAAGNRCCGGPITGCSDVCFDSKNCGGCGIVCGGSPGFCYYGQCWSGGISAKPTGLPECK